MLQPKKNTISRWSPAMGRQRLSRETTMNQLTLRIHPYIPANCPIFHPKDIRVLEKYKGTRILKVLLGGQSMCCKMTDKWTSQSIARELQCLLQISMVDPYPSIRVPKVCGLVGSREQILGFLISYISPHPEAARIDLFDMDTVPIERREKWANQIIQTVEQIHEIGVIRCRPGRTGCRLARRCRGRFEG
jgi:hypothetical protein